ncbi:MAG: hypothetical protein Q7T82_16775 [Armatimonadota bacterium]|nr:hypothetical protein [Armatimonadota bacterium]
MRPFRLGQSGRAARFHRCAGGVLKKGAGACPGRYLNSRRFENAVIEKIKEHVLTRDNLTRLVDIVNEETDGHKVEYRQRLESLDHEIGDMHRRLDKLYDALETGRIQLVDLAPRIQQLRQRKEQLQTAKCELEQRIPEGHVELADSDTVARYASDLRDLLNETTLVERKAFIRSFLKEVKVTGEEALLTYMIPLTPEGVTEEKLAVLSTGRDGGLLDS